MAAGDELGRAVLEDLAERFAGLRRLAERALAQVADRDLGRPPGPDLNSLDVIARHQAGNLRSRFTDFLTSDGEKPWRHRDTEFEEDGRSREAIEADWASGWAALEGTLGSLAPEDLLATVTVRGEPHTVLGALNRQLAHHAYHVGQIVTTARLLVGPAWTSLSVPRGGSQAFNAAMGHGTQVEAGDDGRGV
ncbi:MAG: DUF1572 family protein [Planctomycetota bacterium]